MNYFKGINVFLVCACLLGFVFACASETKKSEQVEHRCLAAFDTTFVEIAVIKNLLRQDSCIGIRFYNASTDERAEEIGLLAVCFKPDSSEIYGPGTRNYSMFQPRSMEGAAVNLDRSQARQYAKNVKESDGGTAFSVVFTKEEIERLCENYGCAGFMIAPDVVKLGDDGREYCTMNMMVYKPYGSNSDQVKSAVKSSQPCPPVCPLFEKLLIEPTREENGGRN